MNLNLYLEGEERVVRMEFEKDECLSGKVAETS
jgi:hypothetical protein